MKYSKVTEESVYKTLMGTSLDFNNPLDGVISLVNIANHLTTSRYQVKKHIENLKQNGLVELKCCIINDEYETHPPYWGYKLTEKARNTEEYKLEVQKGIELIKECFGS